MHDFDVENRWRLRSLTKVASTTATVLDVNIPQDLHLAHASEGTPTSFSISKLIYLFLVLSTFVVWWLARRQREQLRDEGKMDDMTEEDWQRPWETKEWMALFGLIAMANDNDWQYTPFRDQYNKSIRERWVKPNKYGLKRLLHRGIIPLFVQDGGVATRQLKWWTWSNKFPYVKLPLFRQSKNRAYFEFLVPYPHKGNKKRFLQNLVFNRQGYGITLRFSEPPPGGKILYSESNPPCQDKNEEHSSVGAESALEFLLPFKKDKVFEKAHGERARQLRWFIRGLDSQKIPLLHHTPSVLVRVESRDWSSIEMDEIVWTIAQEAIPEIPWPGDLTREAARKELERCKISCN
ncbi:Nn.00g086020.m01.CDS01 [Neocucurbitaria sp. VM-36]